LPIASGKPGGNQKGGGDQEQKGHQFGTGFHLQRFKTKPDEGGEEGGHQHENNQAKICIIFGSGAMGKKPSQGSQKAKDDGTKNHHDYQQGCHMKDNIKKSGNRLHLQNLPGQDQMAGAGNGKKFGDPLEGSQKKRL
jgi:hypothetical protein